MISEVLSFILVSKQRNSASSSPSGKILDWHAGLAMPIKNPCIRKEVSCFPYLGLCACWPFAVIALAGSVILSPYFPIFFGSSMSRA